jgi:hypothetical protein
MPRSNEATEKHLRAITVYVKEEDLRCGGGTAARKRKERNRKKDLGHVRCDRYLSPSASELFAKLCAIDKFFASGKTDSEPRNFESARQALIFETTRYIESIAPTGHTLTLINSEGFTTPTTTTGHTPKLGKSDSCAIPHVTGHAENCRECNAIKEKLAQVEQRLAFATVTKKPNCPAGIIWYSVAYSQLSGWRKRLVAAVIDPAIEQTPKHFLPAQWPVHVQRGLTIACLPGVRRSVVTLLLMIFGRLKSSDRVQMESIDVQTSKGHQATPR